jgi:hypothetical protein
MAEMKRKLIEEYFAEKFVRSSIASAQHINGSERAVPLAALSERTNNHDLGTRAERHLGFGFGSIEKTREYASFEQMEW